jgi:hypothetical protein
MASFEVVAMALAPWRHLQAFSEYYFRLGASRVRIYHDGRLENKPVPGRLELTECDQEFWSKANVKRPAAIEDRQRVVYNLAYQTTVSDWILVVDIDEFVFGNGSLLGVLDKASSGYGVVRFGSAEAVFRDGEDICDDYRASVFRKPYNRYLAAVLPHLLYPGLGHVFIRGLLGHSRGKQAIRAGIKGLSVDIHDAHCEGKPIREYDASRHSPHLYLGHYDAMSFVQWREKWKRRVIAQDTKEMGRKRETQLELYAKAAANKTEETLFRRLYCLNRLQLGVLRSLDLVIEKDCPDLRPGLPHG